MSEQFIGMMPILPTTIHADGRLDPVSQRRVVSYCLDNGAVAIGHFGIASEFHKISDTDRQVLTELIVEEVAGRVPVFIGVTAAGVKASLEYAQQAERQGANLIMASLPYINLPDSRGAKDFFRALSEHTSLPIILQDTPASSAVLSRELLAEIASSNRQVKHVKGEGRDFLDKTASLLAMGGDISVIGGAGGKHLIHMLRIGVAAFMTGTEALELHGGAVRAFLDGDQERAAEIYFQRILPYLTFYLDYPEELLKWILHRRGVISDPTVLAPPAAPPMGDIERQEFEWVLDRIGLGLAIDRPLN
jgi:dihydrodipicolinate synthase/N-acetylneuraminate lyase